MYNITLISTVHTERGRCNADELFKIIESIDPEVIFEESPAKLFDIVYSGYPIFDEVLEIKCIRKYLIAHDIRHIPVDIEGSSNLSTVESRYMFNALAKYDVLKRIENEQKLLIEQGGFAYLNSKEYSELFDQKKSVEIELMGFSVNGDRLAEIHREFYQEQEYRENEMLQNIYNYSRDNPFDHAVFLIGAGHRRSIFEKVLNYQGVDHTRLNWTFYNSFD